MEKVFLSLGSNIGERETNLKQAIEKLQTTENIEVTMISSFYDTKPEGGKDNVPNYINAIVEIVTSLSPHELLEKTQEIEKCLGRKTKCDYNPRTIDIDIIFYGKKLVCEEGLTIPHPLMHERFFVLDPLNELAPQEKHPVLGKTVQELLFELRCGYGSYN